MVKIEKRLIKHGHSESHLKSLAEYLERNLSRDLGPKAEAGSMRSESGYQRIAASVSGRIALELGCSEYKAKALSLGAKVSSAVSKNTDYVIIGTDAGTKAKTAQELNITILSEDEFLSIIT